MRSTSILGNLHWNRAGGPCRILKDAKWQAVLDSVVRVLMLVSHQLCRVGLIPIAWMRKQVQQASNLSEVNQSVADTAGLEARSDCPKSCEDSEQRR